MSLVRLHYLPAKRSLDPVFRRGAWKELDRVGAWLKCTEPGFNATQTPTGTKEQRQGPGGYRRGGRAGSEPGVSVRLHFLARGRSTWICSEGKWTFRSGSQEESLGWKVQI